MPPEPQVDPETTAMERRRRSKKKAVRSDEEAFPDKPIKWNKIEAVCLVNCYLGISEDEEVGNAQTADHLWLRVLHLFHEKMDRGIYRNRDMLASKFREINTRVTRYNCIYTQLTHPSGAADEDFSHTARRRYKEEMGHEFNTTLEACWQICRGHEKWRPIEGSERSSSGSKRTRPSDTSKTDASQTTRRRPIGRNRARDANRGGSSTQGGTEEAALEGHTALQRERMEIERLRIEEMRRSREATDRRYKDLAIIRMDPNLFEDEEQRK